MAVKSDQVCDDLRFGRAKIYAGRGTGTGTGTGKPLGHKRPCGSCIINFSSFHFPLQPAAVKLHSE